MSGVAVACAGLALSLATLTGAHAAGRPHAAQDAPRASPAWSAAEFNAEAEKVSRALAASAAEVARQDLEAAVRALDEALLEVRPASLQATLLLSKANVHQVAGQLSLAEEALTAADELLAGLDEATRRRERCAQLAAYLCCQRSRLCLEWGLIDRAHGWATRAKELLPARAAGARGADEFARERILASYVEALVLGSMEDYAALESAIGAALEDELYEAFPGQRSRLLARLGLAWKETARTEPADAARATEVLEEVLADPMLQGLDRLLPELGLAELALRERDWEGAERHLAAATELLGPPEGRAKLPGHAAWSALTARLSVERRDRPASPEALEALRAELASVLQARLADWGRRELRPGGYGFLLYADQQSLASELMRLDLLLEPGRAGTERALSRLFAAGATSTLARRIAAPAVSLDEARAVLLGAKEHALLIYFPAPDRTHLFVVDHEESASFELPAADFLEQARYEVERTLSAPARPETRELQGREREAALDRLAALLLPAAALERLRSRSSWTIVGADLLGPVPFAVLAPEGVPLGTTHALAQLSSPAIGVRLAERARRETRSAAGAGEVLLLAPSLDLDPPLADERIAEMLAAYPAAARVLASGARASLATLRRALPAARVAQVFAHGRYDESLERPAGMLLASEAGASAFVGAEELEELDAPPLVVLTVCGSARAPKRRGDAGAAELSGALLCAGDRARCVVQSSHDLDVESARRLSIAFHAALVAGDSPAEALRKARVELTADERFADPFHHAWLTVTGLGHVPVFVP